jgi:hypothetical protein
MKPQLWITGECRRYSAGVKLVPLLMALAVGAAPLAHADDNDTAGAASRDRVAASVGDVDQPREWAPSPPPRAWPAAPTDGQVPVGMPRPAAARTWCIAYRLVAGVTLT